MPKSKHYRDNKAIKALGKKVREARERTGKTIEDFANSMGLHVTQLARIERGQTNPTISTIFLLAEKLGVKPTSLIDFDE